MIFIMVISFDFFYLQVTTMESENDKCDVKGKVSKLDVASYDNNIQVLDYEQEIAGSAATIKIEKCETHVIESDGTINEGEKTTVVKIVIRISLSKVIYISIERFIEWNQINLMKMKLYLRRKDINVTFVERNLRLSKISKNMKEFILERQKIHLIAKIVKNHLLVIKI